MVRYPVCLKLLTISYFTIRIQRPMDKMKVKQQMTSGTRKYVQDMYARVAAWSFNFTVPICMVGSQPAALPEACGSCSSDAECARDISCEWAVVFKGGRRHLQKA